ncbi:allantoinase AllB [Serinibacter arcticus]|uniref:allantoinase n=1 Tax=Serinibacter arcticus TaxID=1655435 RepID=A0A2U1ZXM5_9MICO|nr:allantoinase AllB [Serinibacter arcticus]PWD51700.1 allantoinase AllB [Serinibacter arcticus]
MTAPHSVAARRTHLGGTPRPATVRLAAGRIVAVEDFDPGADVVLPDDQVLLPGLVDHHVHLDDPGRTEWEGFATGTAAAAAGGVTTVVDMPLNSVPVTTTPDALAAKRAVTPGRLAVDVAYWGGAVPENLGSLAELAAAGVVGFKCFLAPSGIEEFGHLELPQLESALTEIAAFDGVLIVHAEDPDHLHPGGPLGPRYADFLASRPPRSEATAVAAVIEAARRTGARAHVVHLSDGGTLDAVRAARADGVRLTVETCPHYLTLASEDVPDGAGAFKCCPPIRDRANQGLLWQGVLDGTIDAVVSDHSPSTRELKEQGGGDLGLAWGGIAGLQTGLSALWTEAVRRGVALEDLLPLITTGSARIAGLDGDGGPGRIAVGSPAHLVAFAPGATWTVDAAALEYRNKLSPWDGAVLRGVVATTWVHGTLAWTADGGLHARAGREILASRVAVAG